jgi:hypothetical protein
MSEYHKEPEMCGQKYRLSKYISNRVCDQCSERTSLEQMLKSLLCNMQVQDGLADREGERDRGKRERERRR